MKTPISPERNSLVRNVWFALALLAAASPAAAATLPTLEATSLGGTRVVLPSSVDGRPFVLVVGYARESQGSLQAWSHALTKALPDTPLYAAAVVVGAPGLIHGFISRALRKAAPSTYPQHDSRVLLTFNGTGWKQIAPPGKPEDAAVFVIGSGAAIALSIRAPLTDERLGDVVATVGRLDASERRTIDSEPRP
jgi:hypothetical protein